MMLPKSVPGSIFVNHLEEKRKKALIQLLMRANCLNGDGLIIRRYKTTEYHINLWLFCWMP